MNIYVAECSVRWNRSNGPPREGLRRNTDVHDAVDVTN